MRRVILLIDMNAYFASVEQASNPFLRGKPVVVCGEGRTVVTTASYEARKYGVKTGMTLPEARRLCPAVIPVRGTMDKYVSTSLRIHRLLLGFTPYVEAFSIDECFMDISRLPGAQSDPKAVARAVKRRIKEELGLTCSVGIGHNKLVAKLASKMQKPDGLVEIREEDVPALFARLPIDGLQGIGVGRKLAGAVKTLGIETAEQLGKAPISLLTAHFGVLGYRLREIGRGEDGSPVREYGAYEQPKSVGHSHTLPKDTKDTGIIKSYLLMLSEKVGLRLRGERCRGKTVALTVRYADFFTFSRQRSLRHTIATGREIYSAACDIFDALMPLPQAVRLLGVSIGNLTPADRQGFLFEDFEKERKLTETVDGINKKYGEFTVKPLSVLVSERYGAEERCGMMGNRWIKKGSK